MNRIVLPFLFVAVFFSCKKDEPKPDNPAPSNPGGTLKVEMHHTVDHEDMEFGKWYLNPASDSFKVSKFNYYISNIVLVADNGNDFVQPESYHLIRHASNNSFSVNGIPGDRKFSKIRFLVGVDSLRNTSGAQTGALDPVHGMFWSWNSGYIFLKLEGESPLSGAASKAITFHVGGFTEPNKTQRSVELALPQPLQVGSNGATLKLMVDVNEMFKDPEIISFNEFYYQMSPGPGAKKLADNYADMFSVESLQQ